MCDSSVVGTPLEANFENRLRDLLEQARRSLGAERVAVAELMAPEGVLTPCWRAVAPSPHELFELGFDRFKALARRETNPTWLVDATEFDHSLAGFEALAVALRVEPHFHAEADALLLLVFENAPDPALVEQLQRELEAWLSLNRKQELGRLLLAAVDQAADPMEITDSEARLLYANKAWERTFGYAMQQVAGETVGRLFRDPIRPIHDRAFYQFTLDRLAHGKPWLGVIASRTHGGERVLCEAQVSPFTSRDVHFQGNLAVRRKLDHRAERDKALTLAHHEFRAVLSAMPDGVVVLRDTRIYFANPAFLSMVGSPESEVIGRDYADFVHPDDRAQFRREHLDKVTRVRVMRHDTPRFAEISTAGAVSFEAKPAMILLSRDTTDYYVAQEELARAEKLSALGALAAGVAHEINNPLAYVTMNLQQVLDATRSKLLPAELEALEEAIEGASRMRAIVGELKSFSGSDRPGPTEAVDVFRAVSSALNIAQNEIRHRARLERDHEPGLFVLAREGQLVQVLVNVLVNAAQAISSRNADAQLIRVTSRQLSDEAVEIAVSDTGTGIPEGILAHVFDPFATGKQRGEGSGLGLTISKRIIEDLGGQISIQTSSGKGTRVTLQLPRAASPAASIPPQASRVQLAFPRARVLIVDDELSVAKGLKRMLSDHEVVIIRDGAEALKLLERDADFDVVLCDLMMPSLPGSELFQRIAQKDPELGRRFVFMTGGAFTDYGRSFLESVDCPILRKPFDPEVVLESVRNAVLLKRQAG